MSLKVDIRANRGKFELEAEFELGNGEVLAILGPNGAGKSTLLNALAGLASVSQGSIRLGSRVLTDVASGVAIPTAKRRIGLLGQEPLLFPHLSVAKNIEFALRSSNKSKTDALRLTSEWLDRVHLTEFSKRKPAQLSGGQQQKVAIARALATEPEVLLLDEPMARLDVDTASILRELLRDQLRESGTSAILVTHDVNDALELAHRIAIIEEGKITAIGEASALFLQSSASFTSSIFGPNLVEGEIDDDGNVRFVEGANFAPSFGRNSSLRPGQKVLIGFEPRIVTVDPESAPSRK